LGGRSLLASPLSAAVKDRLNQIKGRQSWRPVAPIIQAERMSEFFEGPTFSPNMTYRHLIKPEYRDQLAALEHPDGSTRAQTLSKEDDPDLHRLLSEIDALSGFPIVVNTSFNGPGEPIVETPEDALRFFLVHKDVDYIALGDRYLAHQESSVSGYTLSAGSIVTTLRVNDELRFLLSREGASLEISRHAFDQIGAPPGEALDEETERELLLAEGFGLLIGLA
jgi:carbamoyltransferase